MITFFDGDRPVWQDHKDYPWNEYKHLNRDKFEELLQMMMESYPDHELTKWLQRGFAINEGDSTICFQSLSGRRMMQWDIDHFDEEDAESFDMMWGDGEEEIDWGDDW